MLQCCENIGERVLVGSLSAARFRGGGLVSFLQLESGPRTQSGRARALSVRLSVVVVVVGGTRLRNNPGGDRVEATTCTSLARKLPVATVVHQAVPHVGRVAVPPRQDVHRVRVPEHHCAPHAGRHHEAVAFRCILVFVSFRLLLFSLLHGHLHLEEQRAAGIGRLVEHADGRVCAKKGMHVFSVSGISGE